MAIKGLGAGLGALLGDAAIEEEEAAAQYLPLARIEPRANQPRQDFDETALQELADSIREHGVIQPIVVRAASDGCYEIIAGERRWRACRLAGLREAPVRIIDADDKTASELALVENLQRENLNPMEEALGYRALAESWGLTQEQIAKRVGKSRPVVANSLRLLQLPEQVRDALRSGDLSISVARLILELEKEEDRSLAAEIILQRGLTVRETAVLVKKIASGELDRKKEARPTDPYLTDLETRLGRSLGTKVHIAAGRKKGTVTLEYYGQDDLERLLALLHAAAPHGEPEI